MDALHVFQRLAPRCGARLLADGLLRWVALYLLCAFACALPRFLVSTTFVPAVPVAASSVMQIGFLLIVACMGMDFYAPPLRVLRTVAVCASVALIVSESYALYGMHAYEWWHFFSTRDDVRLWQRALWLLSAVSLCGCLIEESGKKRRSIAGSPFGTRRLTLVIMGMAALNGAFFYCVSSCIATNTLQFAGFGSIGISFLGCFVGLLSFIALGTCMRVRQAWVAVGLFSGGYVLTSVASYAVAQLGVAFPEAYPSIVLSLSIVSSASLTALGLMGSRGANAPVDMQDQEAGSVGTKEMSLTRTRSCIAAMKSEKPLSEREAEVLSFDLLQVSTSEVCGRLGIAQSSVSTYRNRAYRKLGIGSREDLIARILSRQKPESLDLENNDRGGWQEEQDSILGIAPCVATASVAVGLMAVFGETAGIFSKVYALIGVSLGMWVLFRNYQVIKVRIYVIISIIVSLPFGYTLLGVYLNPVISKIVLLGGLLSVLDNTAKEHDHQARQASVICQGEDRARAYLRGKGLSAYESEAVLLTACGCTSMAISRKMHVSYSTVNKYRSRAREMLGMQSRDRFIDLLRKEGVICW